MSFPYTFAAASFAAELAHYRHRDLLAAAERHRLITAARNQSNYPGGSLTATPIAHRWPRWPRRDRGRQR